MEAISGPVTRVLNQIDELRRLPLVEHRPHEATFMAVEGEGWFAEVARISARMGRKIVSRSFSELKDGRLEHAFYCESED